MKNKFLMCAMLMFVAGSVMAAGTTGTESRTVSVKTKHHDNRSISYFTKQHFATDFPDAVHVTWKNTNVFQEAHFMLNNIPFTAYYDADDVLVGTTTAKTFNDLPVNAQRYIQKKYADYKAADVIFFEDNQANETDMNLYDQPFEDEDNYFVLMKKPGENIVLKVNAEGYVDFFKKI